MSITNLVRLRNAAMADGTINAGEASGLARAARTSDERTTLRGILERDTFEPGSARATLEKRVSNPPNPVLGKIVFDGQTLPVIARQQIGPPEGYRDRFQAQAAAAALPNAAVVVTDASGHHKVYDTGWSRDLLERSGASITPPDLMRMRVVSGPSDADQRYLAEVKRAKTLLENFREKKGATAPQVAAAYRGLVARGLGVGESQVNVIFAAKDAVPGKINVNLSPLENAMGQLVTRDKQGDRRPLPSDRTTPITPAAITVNTNGLLSRKQLLGTVLHESTHAAHRTSTESQLTTWRARGAPGASFEDDLYARNKAGTLDDATLQLTLDDIHKRTGATEFYASAEEFMGTFHTGPATATDALTQANAYVPVEKPRKEIMERLGRYYLTLDDAHKAGMAAAMRALTGGLSGFEAR